MKAAQYFQERRVSQQGDRCKWEKGDRRGLVLLLGAEGKDLKVKVNKRSHSIKTQRGLFSKRGHAKRGKFGRGPNKSGGATVFGRRNLGCGCLLGNEKQGSERGERQGFGIQIRKSFDLIKKVCVNTEGKEGVQRTAEIPTLHKNTESEGKIKGKYKSEQNSSSAT